MFVKVFDILARSYYSIKNKLLSCLFIETYIIPHKSPNIGLSYYYYLFNYYCLNYLEYILNRSFKFYTNYKMIKLYEFSYRDGSITRSSILEGTIYDIFNYTRYNKKSDDLKPILKCNIFINNVKNNIRHIVRKYDTSTKLYDIIYFNFSNEVDNENNTILIELGNALYDIRDINKSLSLNDA
jgi:hypothetical protein